MDLQIDSPNPVPTPTPLVVKPGSNILAMFSGGIPLPSSEISIRTIPSSEKVLILIVPLSSIA